jgi:predicted ABC-type ATPase
MPTRPYIVVIGDPNGAGKTTISRPVLAETFHLAEFVNADTIAAGLAAFHPETAAFAAGRVMLSRLRELAGRLSSFAFESTLASRTFAPWLAAQIAAGYDIHFIDVALNSPTLARRRVRLRVLSGGHDVPADVVS